MLVELDGAQAEIIDYPQGFDSGLMTVTSDVDGAIVDVIGIRGTTRLTIARGRGVILDRYVVDPEFDRYELTAGSPALCSLVFLPFGRVP